MDLQALLQVPIGKFGEALNSVDWQIETAEKGTEIHVWAPGVMSFFIPKAQNNITWTNKTLRKYPGYKNGNNMWPGDFIQDFNNSNKANFVYNNGMEAALFPYGDGTIYGTDGLINEEAIEYFVPALKKKCEEHNILVKKRQALKETQAALDQKLANGTIDSDKYVDELPRMYQANKNKRLRTA